MSSPSGSTSSLVTQDGLLLGLPRVDVPRIRVYLVSEAVGDGDGLLSPSTSVSLVAAVGLSGAATAVQSESARLDQTWERLHDHLRGGPAPRASSNSNRGEGKPIGERPLVAVGETVTVTLELENVLALPLVLTDVSAVCRFRKHRVIVSRDALLDEEVVRIAAPAGDVSEVTTPGEAFSVTTSQQISLNAGERFKVLLMHFDAF